MLKVDVEHNKLFRIEPCSVRELIDLRPCQHENGYMKVRSQIKVHNDERTQVHSFQSSLAVTHPSTNLARRYLTSVTESSSKHVMCAIETMKCGRLYCGVM